LLKTRPHAETQSVLGTTELMEATMTRRTLTLFLAIAAVCAACRRESSKPSASGDTTATGTQPGALPIPAEARKPSFDCAKANTASAKLVCKDETLGSLDHEMMRLYELAAAEGGKARNDLVATQRKWLATREACTKEADARGCMIRQYGRRIHEIRLKHAAARSQDEAGFSRGPAQVTCDGYPPPIGVVFINVNPPLAALEWSEDSIVLPSAPSASGAKYSSALQDGTYTFWTKGNEALFTLPERAEMHCRISGT
jgi:membrane-bound inhibitor of C-type lysozyme/uncharacterized protein YecT (DUF1311 family)